MRYKNINIEYIAYIRLNESRKVEGKNTVEQTK